MNHWNFVIIYFKQVIWLHKLHRLASHFQSLNQNYKIFMIPMKYWGIWLALSHHSKFCVNQLLFTLSPPLYSHYFNLNKKIKKSDKTTEFIQSHLFNHAKMLLNTGTLFLLAHLNMASCLRLALDVSLRVLYYNCLNDVRYKFILL